MHKLMQNFKLLIDLIIIKSFSSTLLKHSLVSKWSNPSKYTATDKGLELAARIIRVENGSNETLDGTHGSIDPSGTQDETAGSSSSSG